MSESVDLRELMASSSVKFGTSGVRGLVDDLDARCCYALVASFLRRIGQRGYKNGVVLGMDLRPSSRAIAKACATAVKDVGASVEFLGCIPTPALALHALSRHMPALMVTGSHIPFDRNGIKFYSVQGEISKLDESEISNATVEVPQSIELVDLPKEDVLATQAYVRRYLSFFAPDCLAGMRIGLYQHSSVARDLLREILEALGAFVVCLERSDGFVPIDTESLSREDRARARRWTAEHNLDAVVSTDGDADRPMVADEHGQWLRGDIVGILCAKYLGADAVATTLNCNSALEMSGFFSKIVRTRIGSPCVIQGIDDMVRSRGQRVVGFEPNGGFLVGTQFVGEDGRALSRLLTRDAVLPILCLLTMTASSGTGLSGLVASLPSRFTASDKIGNLPGLAASTLISRLATSGTELRELLVGICGDVERLDVTDGIRIFLSDGEILHFRASGNAPEMRCYAEASDLSRAEYLVQQALVRIRQYL